MELENTEDYSGLSIEDKINHKNWKARCDGYEQLKSEIPNHSNDISFIAQCGGFVTKMTSDPNPNCLDLGLDSSILFFELCENAWASCDQEKVLNNIIDKTFAARQSSLQRGKALILKIIEANDPHQVTTFLLTKILDKRPKVPPTCIDLITEGIILFGANKYPVKDILKTIPPIFNSSNSNARESVMSLIVELHKWIGLGPLQPLLDGLRPAQRLDFDKLVQVQPRDPPLPSLGLKKDRLSGSVSLEGPAPILEARDLVEEIDLSKRLKGSEFSSLVGSEKWADQVQGLDWLVNIIGSTPKFKYNSAITDTLNILHQLLKNGHVQVQIRCLKLISLFADGCRVKVYSELRNLLPTIISRSKEKKIVEEVQSCLVIIFQHVVNIDLVLEEFLDLMVGRKNPPHSKICLCTVLIKLMEKNVNFQGETSKLIFQSLVAISDDSDGKVREISISALQKFRNFSKSKAGNIQMVENLSSTNPKLHRKIVQETVGDKPNNVEGVVAKDTVASQAQSKSEPTRQSKVLKGPDKGELTKSVNLNSTSDNATRKVSASSGNNEKEDNDMVTEVSLSVEDCISNVSQTLQSDWDIISQNLSSSKWQEKVDGLTAIQSHSSKLSMHLESVFIIFSNFGVWKSSNVNVVKAAVEGFTVLLRETSSVSKAITFSLVNVLLEKVADKKLQSPIENLLQEIVQRFDSKLFFKKVLFVMSNAKSPLVRQGVLVWIKSATENLRLNAIPVQAIGQTCLKELENKNPGVRNAALELIKFLYSRIGPPFASVLLSKDVPAQIKSMLELELGKIQCVSTTLDQDVGDLGSEIPRKDISDYLEKSTFNDLNCLEGKDSWQVRKSGIEKISEACNRSGYYLEFNKAATESVKNLKARLNDTQSNLKPLAMQALANLISSFSPDKVMKCLKAVVVPILAGLADNKKPMRDATIAALEIIITLHGKKTDEGIFNYVVLSSSELLNSSIGRLEFLSWINSHSQLCHGDFSDLIQPLLSALQDKTSQVRHECETFFTFLVTHKLITKAMLEKHLRDLSPAIKRSIQNAIDRILSGTESEPLEPKETTTEESEPKVSGPAKPVQSTVTAVSPVLSRSSRREDWSRWPLFPSLPSMYDLSILKNKWRKDYDSFNHFAGDMQDVALFSEGLSKLSAEEISSQLDYIIRWTSYHFANSKDANKLVTLCERISTFLQKTRDDISENELNLFLPFLLNKLPLIFRDDGNIPDVIALLNLIAARSSSRSLLHVIFTTLSLLEDAKSRLVVWTAVERLLANPSFQVTLTEDDFSWFIFLKNHKILPEEKVHCSEVLRQLELRNDSSTFQHLLSKINEIMNLQKPSTVITSKNPIESSVIESVSLDTLIEDLMVVVSLSEKVSTSKCKEILDKTRIVIVAPFDEKDKSRVRRRLRDFLDVFRQMLTNSAKYEDSLICCCLSLFHFFAKEMPDFIFNLNHFELKLAVTSVLELVQSPKSGQDHLMKPSKLLLLSLCDYANPLVYLTVLIEAISSQKIALLVGVRLALLTIERGARDKVSDEQLPLLIIQLESLVATEADISIQLCKTILNWGVEAFGSEKIEGLTSNSLLIESLKQVVSFSGKDERANGEQVVDIIHEITFSKDKQTAITKLHEFKRNNPDVDVNFYLSKLSAPFRKYVIDVFSKLEETENTNNPNTEAVEVPATTEVSSNSSEALRIIENLKARPPSYRAQTSAVTSAVPGSSPIAVRNERIRDSLHELSKNLDLQTSLNPNKSASSSSSLEERLEKLNALKHE